MNSNREIEAMDGKAWWASRGIWGGIVAIAAGIAGFWGVTISPEDQAHLTDLVVLAVSALGAVIGGIMAVIGRKAAKKPIKGGSMKKSIVSLLLVCVLSAGLCGCATSSGSGSGSGITTAQAQAGVDYLQSSVTALQKALEDAKATGDPDKIATAESVLSKAKAAADAFAATLPDASQDQWDVARSCITTAVAVLGPMALQALVAR